ncbi:hypothetical protein DB347_13665 [Opitutaceae bacterium EW11]|nr:hypothetical protein DB347_13665 [Opitutaceae bacterium EW11]
MAQSDSKLVTPVSLAVDAVLVLGFFAFMATVLASHVPSNDKTNIVIWSCLASACMSGVFYLAIQMCRLVYRAQKRAGQ